MSDLRFNGSERVRADPFLSSVPVCHSRWELKFKVESSLHAKKEVNSPPRCKRSGLFDSLWWWLALTF